MDTNVYSRSISKKMCKNSEIFTGSLIREMTKCRNKIKCQWRLLPETVLSSIELDLNEAQQT